MELHFQQKKIIYNKEVYFSNKMISQVLGDNSQGVGKTLKRVSITHSILPTKNEKDDNKQNQINHTQKELLNKLKKIAFEMKQYNFEPFDLTQIEENHVLIRSNYKYATLLDNLRQYNKKILQERQNSIINYKLHNFFYSTLKICKNKTQAQAKLYLKQINKWFNEYKNKRYFKTTKVRKIQQCEEEDAAVRQTYKSNLPLQIDKYERKYFNLPAHKSQNLSQIGKYLRSQNQKSRIMKGLNNDFPQQNENNSADIKQTDDMRQQNMNNKISKRQKSEEYKTQIQKIKKHKQENQQKTFKQSIKKHKIRIQCQSSNNFYKVATNNYDMFNQTYGGGTRSTNLKNTYQIGQKNQHSRVLDEETSDFSFTKQNKQDRRAIINATSMGFYQIKKKKVNDLKSHKKVDHTSTLPLFFHNRSSANHYQFSNSQNFQQIKNYKHQQFELTNIEGFNLMKNTHENDKNRKKKKKIQK